MHNATSGRNEPTFHILHIASLGGYSLTLSHDGMAPCAKHSVESPWPALARGSTYLDNDCLSELVGSLVKQRQKLDLQALRNCCCSACVGPGLGLNQVKREQRGRSKVWNIHRTALTEFQSQYVLVSSAALQANTTSRLLLTSLRAQGYQTVGFKKTGSTTRGRIIPVQDLLGSVLEPRPVVQAIADLKISLTDAVGRIQN